jgi:glycine/D-amino acid oxidase-like deaminating enzyme
VFDLAIIGGGLAGTSLALALAQRDVSVLLIEQSTIGGGGATAHSRGIVRLYDPIEELVTLSQLGIAEWQRLNAQTAGLFSQVGLYYVLEPENEAAAEAFVQRYDCADYPLRLCSAAEVAEAEPWLSSAFAKQRQTILWEPKGGYVNPRSSCHAFARMAAGQGATVLEGCAISAVVADTDRVRLETSGGALFARRAIVAAGAESATLMALPKLFSRSIPLTSFVPGAGLAPSRCIIDEPSKCYLRPQSDGLFYGGGATQHDAATLAALPAADPKARNAENLALCQGVLASADPAVVCAHSGHDGYTETFLPLLQIPNAAGEIGLYSGFSGRGAKYLPALSQHFAQTLCEAWA